MALNLAFLSIFPNLLHWWVLVLHETYDHWSVTVLTVRLRSNWHTLLAHTLSQIVEHCKLESLTTPDNIVWSTVTSCWANNVCQFDLSLTVRSICSHFWYFFKYVAFYTGFNLLTPFFLLPYTIMDLPIFDRQIWYPSLLLNIHMCFKVDLLKQFIFYNPHVFIMFTEHRSLNSELISWHVFSWPHLASLPVSQQFKVKTLTACLNFPNYINWFSD